MIEALGDRLWNRINKHGPAPEMRPDLGSCWLWTGGLNSHGYGRIYFQSRGYRVHRVLWEAQNGPVPSGLELDHLCRVRKCVNPSHLEAVTHRENNRRGIVTPRLTVCQRGHPMTDGDPNVGIKRLTGKRFCLMCSREGNRNRWRAAAERHRAS